MSAPWVTGGRVWARVVERHLAAALMHDAREEAATRAMQRCTRAWRDASEALGPASGASAVWTYLVRPCANALGWAPGPDHSMTLGGVPMRVAHASLGPAAQTLVALPWGVAQDGLQRVATRLGAERDTPWVSVCNGRSWRWYDARRPYARDHLGIDLAHASVDAPRLAGAVVARTARADGPWWEGRRRAVDRSTGRVEPRRGGGHDRSAAGRRLGDARRPGPLRAGRSRHTRDGRVPVVVPAVCRGAVAPADVAPGTPPQLLADHHHEGRRDGASTGDGCAGEPRGDRPAGPSRGGHRRCRRRCLERAAVCRPPRRSPRHADPGSRHAARCCRG